MGFMLEGDLQLQVLIEKAWALHDGLTLQIENSNNNSFCTACCENGTSCNVSETIISFQEKQRLIAIRDSLKDVGDLLMLLRRMRSWQLIDRHAALNRLEESRVILIERVKEYRGRSVDVLKELDSCFNKGNMNAIINKRVADSEMEKKKRSSGWFIICWIRRMAFDPRKWQKALVLAAKFAVVSVTISSTARLSQRKQYCNSSVELGKSTLSFELDVFNGRG